MRNLLDYGVQELSAKEVINIDSGYWGILVAVGLYALSEWDDISAGFQDGINGNGYDYDPCSSSCQ